MKTCVCVFAKPPRPGRVKTRLSERLGPEKAAALAKAFLHDVWALIVREPAMAPVLATTDRDDTCDDLGAITRWEQGEGDLGQKLSRVLERALGDYPRVLAIGADAPDLPPELLRHGVRALETHDAVLAPARDGGFVLLGLRRLPEGALEGLPWSASDTFARTREQLQARGMRVAVIGSWEDVDDYGALLRLQSRIHRSGAAPCSFGALVGLGLEGGPD